MTDRIRRIHQVVEVPAPRWTFEAGMRDVAHEALVVLRHEAMSKWHSHNTTTSQAELKKERKP
jgi:hypothetical protein